MNKAGAAFSVRFLRNGDQITIVRNIVNKDGQGAALFQVVNPDSGQVSPDWTDAANQPIIQLMARSSAGFPVEITGVNWAFDGKTLTFAYQGSTWVTATNDVRFQGRINGNAYELKIVRNIAGKDVVANKQISYEVSYISNAVSDKVQSSVDVLIQQAGTDSHIIQITTDRVELDADHTTAKLTAEAMFGTEAVTVGVNGYTIVWLQDGQVIAGQNTKILNVTRDMVEGGSVFTAQLYKDSSLVAQDGQRINDIADEYQINYMPTNTSSNFVSPNSNASYTLSVTKNGMPYEGASTFQWQIYNALGVSVRSGSGSVVTITAADCLVQNGDTSYYTDVDVQVTADFS